MEEFPKGMNAAESAIRGAATLMLIARNTAVNNHFDYRVLLLKRAAKSAFMPSMYVFPGGVIEKKADFSNDWMELFRKSFDKFGKDFTTLVNIQGPRPPVIKKSTTHIPSEVAFRICAIRETFEESGILLLKSLKDPHQSCLPGKDDIVKWRKEVYADAMKFIFMCRELDCVPDVWSLSEWCNWLTPPTLSRRYDTLFYVCFLDKEPSVLLDDKEMTHSEWMTPAEGASKFVARQIKIGMPQVYELLRFCRFPKWVDLQTFQERRAHLGCSQWQSITLKCTDGMLVVLPLDDLYPSLQYDRIVDGLSNSRSGQVLVHECSETLVQCNSKGSNYNRVVLQSGRPLQIVCNVSLPHGQCLPETDLVRVHELAKQLQAHI